MKYYTVGIKRFFGFKKYRVTGQGFEISYKDSAFGTTKDCSVRMRLHLIDGSIIVIPNIESVCFKIYPDYVEFDKYRKKQEEKQVRKDLKERGQGWPSTKDDSAQTPETSEEEMGLLRSH